MENGTAPEDFSEVPVEPSRGFIRRVPDGPAAGEGPAERRPLGVCSGSEHVPGLHDVQGHTGNRKDGDDGTDDDPHVAALALLLELEVEAVILDDDLVGLTFGSGGEDGLVGDAGDVLGDETGLVSGEVDGNDGCVRAEVGVLGSERGDGFGLHDEGTVDEDVREVDVLAGGQRTALAELQGRTGTVDDVLRRGTVGGLVDGLQFQTEGVVVDVPGDLLHEDVRAGVLGVGVVREVHGVLSLGLGLVDGLVQVAVTDGAAVDVRVRDHLLTACQGGGPGVIAQGGLETAVDDGDPVDERRAGLDELVVAVVVQLVHVSGIGLDLGVPVVDVLETDVDLVVGDLVLEPDGGEGVVVLAVVSSLEDDIREDLDAADGERDAGLDVQISADGHEVGVLGHGDVVVSVAVVLVAVHVERGDGTVGHTVHGVEGHVGRDHLLDGVLVDGGSSVVDGDVAEHEHVVDAGGEGLLDGLEEHELHLVGVPDTEGHVGHMADGDVAVGGEALGISRGLDGHLVYVETGCEGLADPGRDVAEHLRDEEVPVGGEEGSVLELHVHGGLDGGGALERDIGSDHEGLVRGGLQDESVKADLDGLVDLGGILSASELDDVAVRGLLHGLREGVVVVPGLSAVDGEAGAVGGLDLKRNVGETGDAVDAERISVHVEPGPVVPCGSVESGKMDPLTKDGEVRTHGCALRHGDRKGLVLHLGQEEVVSVSGLFGGLYPFSGVLILVVDRGTAVVQSGELTLGVEDSADAVVVGVEEHHGVVLPLLETGRGIGDVGSVHGDLDGHGGEDLVYGVRTVRDLDDVASFLEEDRPAAVGVLRSVDSCGQRHSRLVVIANNGVVDLHAVNTGIRGEGERVSVVLALDVIEDVDLTVDLSVLLLYLVVDGHSGVERGGLTGVIDVHHEDFRQLGPGGSVEPIRTGSSVVHGECLLVEPDDVCSDGPGGELAGNLVTYRGVVLLELELGFSDRGTIQFGDGPYEIGVDEGVVHGVLTDCLPLAVGHDLQGLAVLYVDGVLLVAAHEHSADIVAAVSLDGPVDGVRGFAFGRELVLGDGEFLDTGVLGEEDPVEDDILSAEGTGHCDVVCGVCLSGLRIEAVYDGLRTVVVGNGGIGLDGPEGVVVVRGGFLVLRGTGQLLGDHQIKSRIGGDRDLGVLVGEEVGSEGDIFRFNGELVGCIFALFISSLVLPAIELVAVVSRGGDRHGGVHLELAVTGNGTSGRRVCAEGDDTGIIEVEGRGNLCGRCAREPVPCALICTLEISSGGVGGLSREVDALQRIFLLHAREVEGLVGVDGEVLDTAVVGYLPITVIVAEAGLDESLVFSGRCGGGGDREILEAHVADGILRALDEIVDGEGFEVAGGIERVGIELRHARGDGEGELGVRDGVCDELRPIGAQDAAGNDFDG